MIDEVVNPEAAIRRFLELMNVARALPPDQYHYRNVEDFLLREGRYYAARPLPESYRPMALKGCYGNAATLAICRPALRYCEGVALGRVLPVHHAWCLDADGLVVDPTWRVGRDGWVAEEIGYLGVVIPTATIKAMIMDGHSEFCALDRWWDGFPLLREPWNGGGE